MKHLNLYEDMKTVKSSEMENWSVANNKEKKVYSGNKEFNYKLGSEVIDLLAEYGLGISSVGIGNWLEKSGLLLADEKIFKEYRVNIGKKQGWDYFIEDYEDENDVKYDKLSKKAQEKIDDIYNNLPYESDPDIEFSVFLPNNVDHINEAAMSDASVYLKLLVDSGFGLYSGGDFDEYDVFYHSPVPTKQFLNGKKIVINNNNLEDLVEVSYRLYKDGKVFDSFKELLDGEHTAKEFFNDWLNLMK